MTQLRWSSHSSQNSAAILKISWVFEWRRPWGRDPVILVPRGRALFPSIPRGEGTATLRLSFSWPNLVPSSLVILDKGVVTGEDRQWVPPKLHIPCMPPGAHVLKPLSFSFLEFKKKKISVFFLLHLNFKKTWSVWCMKCHRRKKGLLIYPFKWLPLLWNS